MSNTEAYAFIEECGWQELVAKTRADKYRARGTPTGDLMAQLTEQRHTIWRFSSGLKYMLDSRDKLWAEKPELLTNDASNCASRKFSKTRLLVSSALSV